MDEEKQMLTTGQAYGITILTQYENALKDTREYRLDVVNFRRDKRPSRNLAVIWTGLWFALKPEVETRPDLFTPQRQEEFMYFRKYWSRPIDLTEKDNIDDLFRLAEVIGQILNKLGITKMEKIE